MAFEIHTGIDLHDIQGNVLKGYGPYGFPFARYVFYRIHNEEAGRAFVGQLHQVVTTSAPWTRFGDVQSGTKKPKVTTNVAFTFEGLRSLGLPQKSLLSFPDEFTMGMRARTSILGDDGLSAPDHWDPIWQSEQYAQAVHVLVTINASTAEHRAQRYDEITAAMDAANSSIRVLDASPYAVGVEQLRGHRNAETNDAAYQDAAALPLADGTPGPKEHFGYTDGISDPYIKESGSFPDYVIGGGKRVRDKDPATTAGWEPVATGEFLLGHVDEADEYPVAPIPSGLSKNGTFLVYRKLHENVASYNDYLASESTKLGVERELFAAKLAGRWRNGAPLTTFATEAEADAFMAEFHQARSDRYDDDKTEAERAAAKTRYYELKSTQRGFDYNDDLAGSRCPVGSHTRRANPRGALEFGVHKAFNTPGALVDRRRIARRGLPYGSSVDAADNHGDHGIIFMAIGASINRQFEFVQQQWMNYGNDFRLSNDRDPLIGNQQWSDDRELTGGRMVFEADPEGTEPPLFCTNLPRFVETRGGDYFFVPSLTALANIAAGMIDPT